MSAPPRVRLSREAEIDAISVLLSDAFVNEDGLNYWLKQGPKKDHARKRFFDVAVRDAINPKRDLWIAESEGERLGAAIWLAPGLKSFDWSFLEELTYTPLFFSIAGIKGMGRARQLGAKLNSLVTDLLPPIGQAAQTTSIAKKRKDGGAARGGVAGRRRG